MLNLIFDLNSLKSIERVSTLDSKFPIENAMNILLRFISVSLGNLGYFFLLLISLTVMVHFIFLCLSLSRYLFRSFVRITNQFELVYWPVSQRFLFLSLYVYLFLIFSSSFYYYYCRMCAWTVCKDQSNRMRLFNVPFHPVS